MPSTLVVRNFLLQASQLVDYNLAWQAMKLFTQSRDKQTADELWLLEHKPVYTLGQAGDPSHILNAGDISVIKADRGGQVTYHGPGQLMCYTLVDLKRHKLSVREMVVMLEEAVIELLTEYGITAYGDRDAPGVYVNKKKIAALGLRVSKGRSYHGLCLNVGFDPTPFNNINPCGYEGMEITQLADLTAREADNQPMSISIDKVAQSLTGILGRKLALSVRVLNQDLNTLKTMAEAWSTSQADK